ncbi:hypothetical protein F5B19DRAFT_501914 [Rostrohypoxylon terebratum]|nr:hypothetical protein F5B19DRAFT_501914 [Rostrohypoxylon terebratum]
MTITVISSSRLKGKVRKKAREAEELKAKELLEEARKSASTNVLSVAEVGEQIELVDRAITGEKEKLMPFNIWKALQRSIKARERFSRWYKATKSCSDDELKSHDHFIDVMKKATCLARGQYDKSRPKKPSDNEINQDDGLAKRNIFDCLEVEDLSAPDFPDIPDTLVNEGNFPDTSREDKFLSNLRPMIAQTDLAFVSLFHDLHVARKETYLVFRRLVTGEICLASATLSIAMAIDLIRKAEEDALELADMAAHVYPPFGEVLTDLGAYGTYYNLFKSPDGRIASLDKSSDDLDELLFEPLGLTLMDLRQRPSVPEPAEFDLTRPFAPLSEHYRDSPEKLNTPRVQKGLKEDQILKHFYYEMRLIEGLSVTNVVHSDPNGTEKDVSDIDFNKPTLPFYDIFHDALRPIWQRNRVSLASAFAARVMLDMCEVCGTSLHNSIVLPKEATSYAKRYGFPEYDSRLGLDLETPDFLEAKVCRIEMRTMYELTDQAYWVNFRPRIIALSKLGRQEKEKGKEEDVIWPHESTTFMLDNNLLYGGTAILDLITMSELLETQLADFHFSIFCAAHIYNAARQLAGLDVSWPEMDRVIQLQKNTIFANDIPTTPKAASRRFTYRMGLSIKGKLRGALFGSGPQSCKLQPTATSLIIREYFEHKIDFPRMIHRLEEEGIRYEKTRKRPRQASDRPPPASSTTEEDKREMKLINDLHRVEEYINAMLPDMKFDYINLTRTCNRLMESLRLELTTELGVEYTWTSTNRCKGAVIRVEVVVRMLIQNFAQSLAHDRVKRKAKRGSKAKDGDIKVDAIGSQLKHAAGFMKKFITRELSRGSESQGKPD